MTLKKTRKGRNNIFGHMTYKISVNSLVHQTQETICIGIVGERRTHTYRKIVYKKEEV